jgi:hypothetical protein
MIPRRETRCTWIAPSEDPDARYLIPGCWERVLDWNAPCTCKSTAQELDEAEERIAQLERELDQLKDYHSALRSVVGRHADGRTLIEDGYKLAGEWRAQKRLVAGGERS